MTNYWTQFAKKVNDLQPSLFESRAELISLQPIHTARPIWALHPWKFLHQNIIKKASRDPVILPLRFMFGG